MALYDKDELDTLNQSHAVMLKSKGVNMKGEAIVDADDSLTREVWVCFLT
jgi:hypothetical protein